jgi:ABC-2 type transport system permease protein
MISRVQRDLRVILAIMGKDIGDAIKNKSIFSQILTVIFIIALYRLLPSFETGGELPRLALYDAGSSQLVADLGNSMVLELVETPSEAAMETFLEDQSVFVLGLVLPPELDEKIIAGEMFQIEGYAVHWASEKEIAEATSLVETEIEKLADRSIQIHTDGNVVYSIPDSRGLSFLVSLSVVLVLVIAGAFIVPILMLEEKENKTLDALLVSPASPSLVVLGKAFSGSLYCAIAAAAALILNHTLITHWGLAVLATLCGVLFAVGVGLLLGSIFEVKQQLTLWGFVLVNFLGIPLFLRIMTDILPAGLMKIINIIPTVALSKVFQASFSNRATLDIFGPDLAVVLTGTVIVYTVVVWVVRRSDQ